MTSCKQLWWFVECLKIHTVTVMTLIRIFSNNSDYHAGIIYKNKIEIYVVLNKVLFIMWVDNHFDILSRNGILNRSIFKWSKKNTEFHENGYLHRKVYYSQ